MAATGQILLSAHSEGFESGTRLTATLTATVPDIAVRR
jgi:hypothetical protein